MNTFEKLWISLREQQQQTGGTGNTSWETYPRATYKAFNDKKACKFDYGGKV